MLLEMLLKNINQIYGFLFLEITKCQQTCIKVIFVKYILVTYQQIYSYEGKFFLLIYCFILMRICVSVP